MDEQLRTTVFSFLAGATTFDTLQDLAYDALCETPRSTFAGEIAGIVASVDELTTEELRNELATAVGQQCQVTVSAPLHRQGAIRRSFTSTPRRTARLTLVADGT